MADIFDPESSTLLCDEGKDLCFDDLEVGGGVIDNDDKDDYHGGENPQKNDNQGRIWANVVGSAPWILFPVQSEGDIATLVEREVEYLTKQDFLGRLRRGDLDLSARSEAFDWIRKAHSYYSFGPLSLCLAVNYLDRFLSICDLPSDQTWAVQLLAVACLSIAAKMEETSVPQSIELQVGDPKFVFEAKDIQRMELLVLNTLNWRMNAVTPCSFLEYSLTKISETSLKVMNRSMELILCIIRGIDFLEFKPSEIAAAVAIAETQAVDIDKAISCFVHLEKDRVLKCVKMIKDLSLISKGAKAGSGSSGSGSGLAEAVPQSPTGVLDSAGFSYKSDELTASGSCENSNSAQPMTTTSISCSPETKRKKLNINSSSGL